LPLWPCCRRSSRAGNSGLRHGFDRPTRVIFLCRFGLNKKQGVIELDVGIAEPESLKSVAALTIGSAEEVLGACSLTDGLFYT
jgi:hypothetical protein